MKHDPVEIRSIEPGDGPGIHSLLVLPEVARWLGSHPYEREETTVGRLQDVDGVSLHRLVAVRSGRVSGTIGLRVGASLRDRHVGTLGMAVHPEVQGHGLGGRLLGAMLDAADRWMGLVRVQLDVHADNERAIRLYRRHGFEVEVRSPRDMLRDGRLVDGLGMARIRPGFVQAGDALRPPPSWPPPGGRPPDGIEVRAARVDDAAAFAEMFREESVVWGTMQLPTGTEALWRRRLTPGSTPGRHIVLVAVSGGLIVGTGGLHGSDDPRLCHQSGLGMGIRAGWQGRGIGRRMMEALLDLADNWLGLRRVWLEVYTDNLRARRLYETAGFVPEGVRRYATWRDGGYCDSLVMARLTAA